MKELPVKRSLRCAIIQGSNDATSASRSMRVEARIVLLNAFRKAHRWLDELQVDPRQTIETIAAREG